MGLAITKQLAFEKSLLSILCYMSAQLTPSTPSGHCAMKVHQSVRRRLPPMFRFASESGFPFPCMSSVVRPLFERASIGSIALTFLGTASAQPSSTRNHSALALRLGRDVWIFDCGEATQHQLQKSAVKMGKIEKIFITHTHGAQCIHILCLL